MPLSTTHIVNVIRLKLFTVISIVYKYGTIDIVYYNIIIIIIPDWNWHAYKEGIYIHLWYNDLAVSLALECC